jgi:predicted MFS family arabinose efflux permease
MSTASAPLAQATPQPLTAPSSALVTLLAASAGLSVAALYYSQPILATLVQDLGVPEARVGAIPMLTQLGYAAGILLLSPLGDRYDRRQVILVKFVLLTLLLLLCALAPGFATLAVFSAVLGLTATLAQDIVPMAAALSPASSRGRVVGQVMTGLLLGILLSRVASGLVAEQWGWRWVYALAAILLALAGLASWRVLPSVLPTTRQSYPALLASLRTLWNSYPSLRAAALAQGLLSVGFSAFWSTLAVLLHQQFHLGSAAAGAFGLAGAAGALVAPLAGRLADRRGPGLVTQLGALLAALAFAAMSLATVLSREMGLLLLVVTAVVFDFGVQAVLVAHQTLVYGLDPGARSRLNALLFTCMFLGMAIGAALGSLALAQLGWGGVAALATLSALGALALRFSAAARQ